MPEKNKESVEFTVRYTITEQYLQDVLVSAYEGGVNYWCEPTVESRDNYLNATLNDLEEGQIYVVNLDKLKGGLRVMALDYPKHFGDLMSNNHDAITADTLVQCAVFGTVRYG